MAHFCCLGFFSHLPEAKGLSRCGSLSCAVKPHAGPAALCEGSRSVVEVSFVAGLVAERQFLLSTEATQQSTVHPAVCRVTRGGKGEGEAAGERVCGLLRPHASTWSTEPQPSSSPSAAPTARPRCGVHPLLPSARQAQSPSRCRSLLAVVQPGWRPGAHPAAPPLPSQRDRREDTGQKTGCVLAGTGSVGRGGSFWQPLTEATPVAPRYQNLATQTRYTGRLNALLPQRRIDRSPSDTRKNHTGCGCGARSSAGAQRGLPGAVRSQAPLLSTDKPRLWV